MFQVRTVDDASLMCTCGTHLCRCIAVDDPDVMAVWQPLRTFRTASSRQGAVLGAFCPPPLPSSWPGGQSSWTGMAGGWGGVRAGCALVGHKGAGAKTRRSSRAAAGAAPAPADWGLAAAAGLRCWRQPPAPLPPQLESAAQHPPAPQCVSIESVIRLCNLAAAGLALPIFSAPRSLRLCQRPQHVGRNGDLAAAGVGGLALLHARTPQGMSARRQGSHAAWQLTGAAQAAVRWTPLV